MSSMFQEYLLRGELAHFEVEDLLRKQRDEARALVRDAVMSASWPLETWEPILRRAIARWDTEGKCG